MTKTLSRLLMAACLAFALVAPAAAQDDYPNKAVRVIVPFAPGGLNDILARVVSAQLSERLGKQFIVENKTGAGGIVGSELVAKAPADGYTLLIVSIAHAVNPALYKLPYDSLKAFAPISLFATSPNALAVNPDLPAKSVKEFIALAKSKPGDIQYGSGGVGGSLHLGMELFKLTTGIDLVHVPFRGAGPAIIDVAGGHTKAIMATIATLSPHVRSGKLRMLGVSGKTRSGCPAGCADVRRAGNHGLRGGQLDRHRRAGRHAARGHRPSQQGNLDDPGQRRLQEQARRRRCRGREVHAGRIQRLHGARARKMGPRGQGGQDQGRVGRAHHRSCRRHAACCSLNCLP